MTGDSSTTTQLRLGLWYTVNERYPASMIHKDDIVPLARLDNPLTDSRLIFVSSAGVQSRGSLPFDVVHPVGDFSFRRLPSDSRPADLEIHQLKYPTSGAMRDLNVIYPAERLQELAREGAIGGLTRNFISFIGYNMDADRFERTFAEEIAAQWLLSMLIWRCLPLPDRYDISLSRSCRALLSDGVFRPSR